MATNIHEDKTKYNMLKRKIGELHEIIAYEMTYECKDDELIEYFDEAMISAYKLWCQLIKEG